MKRTKRMKGIAILSTITVVGGIAISSFAGLNIYSSNVEQSQLLLPAAQKAWSDTSTAISTQAASIKSGTFLGTMNIPSIKKSANIFQGTDSRALSKGVGHYLGSVMPGVTDNSVLSGHRDTVFSNLGKVKVGEFIIVTVQTGTYIYKVERLRIVDRNDRTVIVPTVDATLTLSTCYPFRFIGNAPKRYVVVAKLIPEEIADQAL
jgi:sortase A